MEPWRFKKNRNQPYRATRVLRFAPQPPIRAQVVLLISSHVSLLQLLVRNGTFDVPYSMSSYPCFHVPIHRSLIPTISIQRDKRTSMNHLPWLPLILTLLIVSRGKEEENKAVINELSPPPAAGSTVNPSAPAKAASVQTAELTQSSAPTKEQLISAPPAQPVQIKNIECTDSYTLKTHDFNQVTLGIKNNMGKDIIALAGCISIIGDLDEVLGKSDIKFDSHTPVGSGSSTVADCVLKDGEKLYFTTFLFGNGQVDVFVEHTPASVLAFYANGRSKHPEIKDEALLENAKIDRKMKVEITAVKYK